MNKEYGALPVVLIKALVQATPETYFRVCQDAKRWLAIEADKLEDGWACSESEWQAANTQQEEILHAYATGI